jgi:hypothetical protein
MLPLEFDSIDGRLAEEFESRGPEYASQTFEHTRGGRPEPAVRMVADASALSALQPSAPLV